MLARMTRSQSHVRNTLVPLARDLRFLTQIDCHGPQSSEFLYELTRDTHRCKDSTLRRIQALREAEYLHPPAQQNQIAKADFNPKVYGLTLHARRHLRGLGRLPPLPPTGHWWHAFLTASVTSAISIAAARRGYQFIPAHDILRRTNAPLAMPLGRRRLIPDQLFALNYGNSFRSFVLEVDRGTEPYRSAAARKSLQQMLRGYASLTASDAIRRHYALKSPLLILLLFTAPARAARCLELIEDLGEVFAHIALVAVVPPGFPRFKPLLQVCTASWQRALHAPLSWLE